MLTRPPRPKNSPWWRCGSTEEYLGGAENLAVPFASRVAIAWGYSHLTDAAEGITSHLVTRAVGLTDVPNPPPRLSDLMKDPPPLIGVRLRLIHTGLLIEIWDSHSGSPFPRGGGLLDLTWLTFWDWLVSQRFDVRVRGSFR